MKFAQSLPHPLPVNNCLDLRLKYIAFLLKFGQNHKEKLIRILVMEEILLFSNSSKSLFRVETFDPIYSYSTE